MAETVIMPKLGFDMAEGTLVRWVIGEGQPVTKGAVLAEIETDKATVEVESSFEGIVARHLVPQGSVVPVNTPIAIVAQPGEKLEKIGEQGKGDEGTGEKGRGEKGSPQKASPLGLPPSPLAPQPSLLAPRSSPLARKIASEKGIPLQSVTGTGPGGRIVKRDVEKASGQLSAISSQQSAVSDQRLAVGEQPSSVIGHPSPIPLFP